MPVYNSGVYLEDTIKSVLTQSYKNLQLIIIDDGSTDDSFQIAKRFAKIDNRILLLHQKNHGVSSARNNGLKYVKGDILIFIDSDDTLCENALERIEYEMSLHNYDLLIYSWNIKSGINTEPFIIKDNISNFNYVYKSIAGDDFKCGGGFPWNKAWKVQSILLNNCNLLSFDFLECYEDKLWILKCLDIIDNPKIGYCKEPLYNYNLRFDSLSHANTKNKMRHLNYTSIECLYKIKEYVALKHSNYDQLIADLINIRILYALWWDIKNKEWDYKSDKYYKKLKVKISSVKDFIILIIVIIYKKLFLRVVNK